MSLALAGCTAAAVNRAPLSKPISAENPGTSVTIKNPDPGKWALVPPAPNRPGFWICKPMACSGAAAVSAQTARSPTRNPDKTALEKAAKLLPTQFKAQDLMMEAASEGDERITSLSSKVTSVRDYPAIVAEAKRTTRGKSRFMLRADIFVGMVVVRMESHALTRAEAMKHFESFAQAMEITDVEGPGTAAPANTASTSLEAPPAVPAQ